MKRQMPGGEKPKSRAYYRVHATHELTGHSCKDKGSTEAQAAKVRRY